MLFMLLLRVELDKRKEEGSYKGKFIPKRHFFGYEGRCAMPSNFDASMCFALGKNAALMVKNKLNGYISCIKNLKDSDQSNWIAAATPLPLMIHIEKKAGKDRAVIKKYLVDLEGDSFKTVQALREKWAMLDCYRSPGPIQFEGQSKDFPPFLVEPPNIERLLFKAYEFEKAEIAGHKTFTPKPESNFSRLRRWRNEDPIEVPDLMNSPNFTLHASKKLKVPQALNREKIDEQFP